MTDIRNPASRLLNVLTDLKSADQSRMLLETLPEIFHDSEHGSVYRNISTLVDLPDAAKDALITAASRSETPMESPAFQLYTRWIPNVRTALSQFVNLSATTASVSQNITDSDLTSLEAASYWLAPTLLGNPVHATNLDELRERCNALYEAIVDNEDLPFELQRALLVQLNRISEALDSAWLVGTRPLQQSSDEAYGAIIRTLVATEIPNTAEEKTLIRKFGEFVQAVGITAGVLGGALALPGQAAEAYAILSGHQGIIEQSVIEQTTEPEVIDVIDAPTSPNDTGQ